VVWIANVDTKFLQTGRATGLFIGLGTVIFIEERTSGGPHLMIPNAMKRMGGTCLLDIKFNIKCMEIKFITNCF
jgi:hypothetical protein